MTLWAIGGVMVLMLAWFTFFGGRGADANILAEMPAPGQPAQSLMTPLTNDDSTSTGVKPAPRSGPEIIKKAIVPPVWEVEQVRGNQNAATNAPPINDTNVKTQRMVDAAPQN